MLRRWILDLCLSATRPNPGIHAVKLGFLIKRRTFLGLLFFVASLRRSLIILARRLVFAEARFFSTRLFFEFVVPHLLFL